MDHGTGNAPDHELRIWLFGEFRVAVDRVEVPRSAWQRSKARAVVKVLALASGHRLHREQLMDGLWPDLGPVAASANLRKAIHFARGAMGAHALRVDNEVVRLDGASLWIDVDVFEAAAASGDSAAALGFYVDDLLVEDRFAPWCERRRDQLRAVAARLLLDRSRELEGQGDQRGAIAALERLLQLEPLSEAGHCGLIRLHTLAGRRHVALRWYRQLEDRLRAELGVAPGDEARRLRDDLIAGNVPPEAASIDEDHRDRGSSATLDEERKLVTVAVLEIGGATAGPGRVAVAGRNPERVRAVLDAATT